MAREVEEGPRLEAGSTPSMPFPVPWFAGCGGSSGLAASALLFGLLVSNLLASGTTVTDVSGVSGAPRGIALVIFGIGCPGTAEATFIAPALTWTVFTLTGFI